MPAWLGLGKLQRRMLSDDRRPNDVPVDVPVALIEFKNPIRTDSGLEMLEKPRVWAVLRSSSAGLLRVAGGTGPHR
jgi:hypothetical protein